MSKDEKEAWEHYKSYFKDFNSLNKKDLVNNLMQSVKNLFNMQKDVELLDATEKDRIRLQEENNLLKKKIGEFAVIKRLMDSAGIYGYTDLITNKQVKELGEMK